MYKLLLSSILALGAAGVASAQTADAPTWTGTYAGVHAGWGIDDGRKQDIGGTSAGTVNAVATGARPSQISQDRGGFVGGGQVGFNFQRGQFVFGPEGDFSYMHSRGTARTGTVTAAGANQQTLVRNRMDWMGSARIRGGYILGDGLVYGTGGYAFGKVRGSAAFNGPTGAELYAGSNSYTAQGWTAGLGAEVRPFHEGAMSRIGFGAEATYYDLGRNHTVAQPLSTANTGSYIVGRNPRGFNGVIKANYAF